MKRRGSSITWLIASAGLFAALCTSVSAEIVARSGAKQLDMQRTWHTQLPLNGDETIERAVLLDDNLYLLTSRNAVFTLHAPTGVLRWVKPVAEEGQVIRGPTHSENYAFFTTTGEVRVMHRHSGLAAGEPRHLEGVIIEVVGQSARLSIGDRHGVRGGDVLEVRRREKNNQLSEPLATVEVTSVKSRESLGRITRIGNNRPASGDVVTADVVLPLAEVRLPHAASGPAVVDNQNRLYFAAANQRLFSIDLLGGFEHYQLLTPRGMTIMPMMHGDDMYIADREGTVTSFDRLAFRPNWEFKTEGPIFADLAVSDDYVLIASSDRSLYCLDRRSGKRLWRNRFDKPLMKSPVLEGGRVYMNVDGEGVVALDVTTGDILWRRADASQFLARVKDAVYLVANGDYPNLLCVDADSGKVKADVVCQAPVMTQGSSSDEALYLISSLGEVESLRHKSAPRLTKETLAAALRNNELLKARSRLLAKQQAEKQAKAPATLEDEAVARRKRLQWLFEDDWLASKSTVKPVGGSGLIEPAGAQEADDAVAEDEGEADIEDEGEEDDDEWDDEEWEEDDWEEEDE